MMAIMQINRTVVEQAMACMLKAVPCDEMYLKHSSTIAELRAALEQSVEQEPVAWLFQNEETGLTECVDVQQVEWGFEKNNPRWKKIHPLYTAPQPQPQPVGEPVAWMWADGTITKDPDRADGTWVPLFVAAPVPEASKPAKPWIGLDQHDFDVLFLNKDGVRFARYIEAKLKEKNNG